MTASQSAGVYKSEDDRSQQVRKVSTSIGAIVGESRQGPTGVPFLITTKAQFIKVFGNPDASLGYLHYCALAFLEEAGQIYVVRVEREATYSGASVFYNLFNTAAAWIDGPASLDVYQFRADELFTICALNKGKWSSGIRLDIYPNTAANDGTFYIDIYAGLNLISPAERHLVSMNYRLDGYSTQVNVAEYINRRSSYIRILQNLEHPDFVANPEAHFISSLSQVLLEGGTDGNRVTTGDLIQGWDLFADPEKVQINLLINAGYSQVPVQQTMVELCRSRMDCFAVLDMPSDQQLTMPAVEYRRFSLNVDNSYGGIFTPDVYVLDTYTDQQLYIPPSGHVAARMAYTDSIKAPWWAGAGMQRGAIAALGVRVVYGQDDRDVFADHQINPLRVIPGAGIFVWGADTLQSMQSALSNIPVRRLCNYLEQSLEIAALYSVFDPNDEDLRSSLWLLCNNFLVGIKSARGLYSFGVQCDDGNNPPESIAIGDLHLDIFIDPTLHAKRIFLNAIINKTGAQFN